MKSVNINYIPALDHLRLFAASTVVVYHGILFFSGYFFGSGAWTYSLNPLYTFFIEGHSAVALFMALSGFLFTIGSHKRRIDYRGFVTNRFLRIYPLFIAIITAGLLSYPEAFSIGRLLRTLLLTANMPGALVLGEYSTMFWTISVEFQFYLLFPLIFTLMGRYGPRAIFAAVAAAIALRAAAVYAGFDFKMATYWTLVGRIDQFLIGMIAAALYLRSPELWRRALAPSVALVAAMLWAFNMLGGWPSTGWWRVVWPAVEASAWALFLLAYVSFMRGRDGIIVRSLARLGELSYSMYLTHVIIWYAVVMRGWQMDFSPDPVLNAFANSALIILPATIAVSAVSYNLVERPFLRLRKRYLSSEPARPASAQV